MDATAPLEEVLNGIGFGEAVLSVFRATNMLSPFENTRFPKALPEPRADAFIRGAAQFTGGQPRDRTAAAVAGGGLEVWRQIFDIPILTPRAD